MKRASYREAIRWLADNDDNEWIEDDEDMSVSVTAALIADIFDVPQERVRDDLRRLLDNRAKDEANAPGSRFGY